jgi:hypothetical protein
MTALAPARGALKWPLALRLDLGPATAGFALAFTATLAVAMIQGPKLFYGDSGEYWSLASTFTRNGHFSLINFESPVRGYGMPLIAHLLGALVKTLSWSQSSIVKVFNALQFSLIGAVLVPQIAEHTWPERKWNLVRRLALAALLIIFWSGDLNYPLSDFPGLALVLLAIVAVAHADSPGWMLTAGAASGLAVDMRPAYLPAVPMLLVIVGLTWWRRRAAGDTSRIHQALCVALLVIGFAGASLPQSLASHRHYRSWSFIPGGPAHLTEEQLTSGLYLQRYDTFATPARGAAPMPYFDTTGANLISEQPGQGITSVGQYLRLVEEHPVAIIGLTARHVVNGLDMRYSTVYVEHIDSGGHLWLRVPGFLLVFLALVRMLWPTARRSLGPARWHYPVALLLCCVTSVVTAIETRYMLPVWLLCAMLVLTPGWPSPISKDRRGLRRVRTLIVLVAAYLAFMAIVWHVVSGATARVLT